MRACKPSRRQVDQDRAATAFGKLKEPFAREDVSRELGCDVKKASNLLQKFRAKGWIKSPEHGKWERTAAFGGGQERSRGEKILAEIHEEIASLKKDE